MDYNKQALIDRLTRSVCESIDSVFDEIPVHDSETYRGELNKIKKEVTAVPDGYEITYHFGKNGAGLTRELMVIGQDISRYGNDYYVTIKDCFIDQLDDVYDLIISCQKWRNGEFAGKRGDAVNEGAWGYTPAKSDSYWDKTHDITADLKKKLVKGLKGGDSDTKYVFMGLVNGFLTADDIWNESIRSDGYNFELYKAYKAAYEAVRDDDAFVYNWSDSKQLLDELDRTFDYFKKTMTVKYECIIPEIPEDMKGDFDGHLCDLKPGTYKGWFYAHVFELENGKTYYCPVGVRHGKKCARLQEYEVSDGRLIDKSKPVLFGEASGGDDEPSEDGNRQEPEYAVNDNGEKLTVKDIPEDCRDTFTGTINDLKNGIYVAKLFGYSFKLQNGEIYYTGHGPKRSERMSQWTRYKVKNGKIQELTKME